MTKRRGEFLGYLPTAHGRPAAFCDNYQLCIGGGRQFRALLVPTLREVKRQIAVTIRNRRSAGFEASQDDYGYVRVGRWR